MVVSDPNLFCCMSHCREFSTQVQETLASDGVCQIQNLDPCPVLKKTSRLKEALMRMLMFARVDVCMCVCLCASVCLYVCVCK